ncbi:ABC transporter permease [Mycobacterium sp. KBS0706]|uniref:ABC transporter permease n=1 Tax=Mycobacterium sp. KBS0706 TaxID=2578109 RepID=UPI00110F7A94|nr:ABC transporter permease [Mycobacterium sp. KBS0706]TSD83458.1 ABC transporter permease [Mycobacterium sp. KBS0706]
MTEIGVQTEDEAAIAEARRAEPGRIRDLAARIAIPVVAFGAFVVLWQWYVTAYQVPRYILPAPTEVAATMVGDWPILSSALAVTLTITFAALAAALVGGVALAILFIQSRWLELAFYPYAVVLQVTPIVAIAPLIIIYAPSTESVLLICAFIVAFFPILSNMTQGLKSTDHNLLNLFELYGASRWQSLLHLRIPAALPYFATGLRIGGGLALIGSVVAEFAAGSAGAQSGLAFRILEAGRRLNVPRLFAALILITLTGLAIFALTSLVSHLLLRRWHESAIRREN